MDTLKAQSDTSNNKLLWALPYAIVLVELFFSFAGLSEFYNVAIKGETGAYPWGPVNEVPWYYRTPSTYLTYNLTSGLLFLTATILIIWATVKRNRKFVGVGIGLAVLLVLIDLISATFNK